MTSPIPSRAIAQPTRRSKEPRTILAGPYEQPLHPILVTVSIGAWVSSLVFDLAAFVADEAKQLEGFQ